VYFNDDEYIDDIIEKPTIAESMFTSWMECNKKYKVARTLTYPKIVSKFVYVKKDRCWKPKKIGNTIGRLIWVPPSTGELFYLRRMLTVVKGPLCYEHIRTVDNILYPTFREACEYLGFLADDTKYVEVIKEAKDWGSGNYLRNLFVTKILSNTINKPHDLWEKKLRISYLRTYYIGKE